MIDLGLSKLAIIGVVALMVIGPEKLPKVARMAGSLYGRAQRYLNDIKAEVSREMELDGLKNLHQEVRDAAHLVKSEVEHSIQGATQGESQGESPAATQGAIASNLIEVEDAWRNERLRASAAALERKAREFRRKKLLRTAALPLWYKQRHGGKLHVMSGAARVAKFRLGGKSPISFY